MSSNRGQSPRSSIEKQAGDGQVEKPSQISIQQEAHDGHASMTNRIFNQQEESDGSLQESYQEMYILIMKTVILSCPLSSTNATYRPECTILPTTECWEMEKPHVEHTALSEEQCHPAAKQMCEKVHHTVKSRKLTSQECNQEPKEHCIDVVDSQFHTEYEEKCMSVNKMSTLPEEQWDHKLRVQREMVTIVTENVCTKTNVEVCRPVPHEEYKDVQDEVTREVTKYVDEEHCEDITTTSNVPVTKTTCNDMVEKVPRREVCVDKPMEECGDEQKPVATYRIYYQNEKDNRIDAVSPDEVMRMHEKAGPDKEGREPSAKVTAIKHEPPVTASPLPSSGQSQGDNRISLNISKSWVFYVVRVTHCSHNNGDDVTREGSTACTVATQHGVTDNNLHLQLPDQSTDDHAQLLHHHPDMVRKNHLSDIFTPVKVENKLMGSFSYSTYRLIQKNSQDLEEVHIVFKDDDSSKMAAGGCWPTNTAPRGGNTATQHEANSNLQHQAQLLTDLQHHHHQECWQTNTAPGAGVSTEMLKDRNEIEGTDPKHRPNAETIGGGNTASQHESTDSNLQQRDLSADDQAQLLRGLRHHHHHHSEVDSVDLLPDTRLEVTPVKIGNKFLGCCFSSTCLLNLKTEMTADRVHQLRKHSPNQKDDLGHFVTTVIRIEGSKAGIDKASRELHGMVDRMENGFHRQLVGPNEENIEKIGKDFATVQSSFPNLGVKGDIVKLEGPKRDVDDCSKDFNTIAKEMAEGSYQVKIHKCVIGKGGAIIRRIKDKTDSEFDLPDSGSDSNMVTITVKKENVPKAVTQVQQIQSKELSDEKQLSGVSVEVKAKPQHHRFIIEGAGFHTTKIKEEIGARIIFPGDNYAVRGSITVVGNKEAAKATVAARVKEPDNIVDESITVDHRHFVAKRAEVLKRIGDEFGGVVISFPGNGMAGDKFNLKGARNCIDAAMARLNETVKDLGEMVTIDCAIEQPDHRTVMGAKDSKVQEITTDFNVQIKFPDNDAENGGQAPPVSSGDRSSNYNIISTTGKEESCEKAANILQELVPIITEVSAPYEFHKYIIGQKETDVGEMMNKPDVNIRVPAQDADSDVISISEVHTNVEAAEVGMADKVTELEAEKEIKIQKSFEVTVKVYHEYPPEIIGRVREVIKKLSEVPNSEVFLIIDVASLLLCVRNIILSSSLSIGVSNRGSTAYATANRDTWEVIPYKDTHGNLQVQVSVDFATKDTAYLSAGNMREAGHCLQLQIGARFIFPGANYAVRGSTVYTTAAGGKWEVIPSKDDHSNLQVQIPVNLETKDTAYLSVGNRREAGHSLQQQVAGQALPPTSSKNVHGLSEGLDMLLTFHYQTMPVVATMEPNVLSKYSVEYSTLPSNTTTMMEFIAMKAVTRKDSYVHFKTEVVVKLVHMIMDCITAEGMFYNLYSTILKHSEANMSLGTGLHHARLYAHYFHEDMEAVVYDGLGADGYIYAMALASTAVERMPKHNKETVESLVKEQVHIQTRDKSLIFMMTAQIQQKTESPVGQNTIQIGIIHPHTCITSILVGTYAIAIFHVENCFMVDPKVLIKTSSYSDQGNSEPASAKVRANFISDQPRVLEKGKIAFKQVIIKLCSVPLVALCSRRLATGSSPRSPSSTSAKVTIPSAARAGQESDLTLLEQENVVRGPGGEHVSTDPCNESIQLNEDLQAVADLSVKAAGLEEFHPRLIGLTGIEDQNKEYALDSYLRPQKIQLPPAKNRLIKQIMTCPATSSFSMTGFNTSKDGFICFIQKASTIKKSDAHGEQYYCLLKMFEDADTNRDGLVSNSSFSKLVSLAASVLREYSYATVDTELHKIDESKELARQELIDTMDLEGTGVITIEDWLRFCMENIAAHTVTVNPHPILDQGNEELLKEFLTTAGQSRTAEHTEMHWLLLELFTEHDAEEGSTVMMRDIPNVLDKAQASSRNLRVISLKTSFEDWLDNWEEESTGTITDSQTSTPTAGQAWLGLGMFDLMSVESISTLSSCSLSSAMSWETKARMFCPRCQDFDLNQDPYSLASLPTGALQTETFVCVPLPAMNMATHNSARFSAAQGVLHRQFGSFTLQASSQYLKFNSLQDSIEEWFDNARMVVNTNVFNRTAVPIMLTCTDIGMCIVLLNPYSLASLSQEDLPLLTHDYTLLFIVNLAIHNSARFSTAGSFHGKLGESHIQASNSCLKKLISLHNTFEDWLDNAQIDIISVMTRPTVPIVFTVTSLVMGYVNMESDEFLCRRAVFPPDSFVVFLQLARAYAA